jgi:hypothetical protein
MSTPKHPLPDWVTRGKTIKDLIEELRTFENQDAEVRLSLDYGDTAHCISIVMKSEDSCVLANAEAYHLNEWQDFIENADDDTD